jgi:two-component system, LuxR family, sensor kinase FixL
MSSSHKRSFDAFTGLIPIRLLVPLLLTIFVIIVGLWNYMSTRRAVEIGIEREVARDLTLDMTRLQASLEEAAHLGANTWMQDQLAAFGADTHGLLALLSDEKGEVLASANRSHLGKPVTAAFPQTLRGASIYQSDNLSRTQATRTGVVEVLNEGSVIAGVYPVLLGSADGELRPNRIGHVFIARDLDVLKSQELMGSRRRAVHIGLVLLLSALATSLLMHWLVTKRLVRIARAADQLATGDLTVRSGVSGRDEIALLGHSFDAMVTDLEQHEAALVESEERHRSLFLHAVEGIVTMGEDRIIQSMNPAAQKLFGYQEEEVIGENVKILMPSPYHEEHDGYVKSYIKTGKKKIIGIGREVIGRRKDGTTFPLELSVVELQLSNVRLFTGILRDITERKRAKDELLRINEHLEELVQARTQALEDAQETLVRRERLATLGQLAGSVAHEIRNPLGIVRNAAFYLEQVSKDQDKDTIESHAEIRRGLTRADRIISELLDYARDPQAHHREFALADMINDAFSGVEIPLNTTVDAPIPSPSPICYGDPDQISRILKNLVINALQAMPDGGALTIRCSTGDDGQAMIEVQDTGTGMAKDQLVKIFEPLFTTKTQGIGLGLALSLRYAELNNGSLTAESSLGGGSTFRLTIPIANA